MKRLRNPLELSSMGSGSSNNSSNQQRLNNSKHFTEVSRISDALKLYTTLGGGAISLDDDMDNEEESEIFLQEGGGITSVVKHIAGISSEAITMQKSAASAASGKTSQTARNIFTVVQNMVVRRIFMLNHVLL